METAATTQAPSLAPPAVGAAPAAARSATRPSWLQLVLRGTWKVLTSLQLTIVGLGALMVLVVGCTLAQVDLGSFQAVHLFMNSIFLWVHLPGTHLKFPVFPGGALVGVVLMVNLVFAQVGRLQLRWRKAGIWLTHAGLILMFAGQFIAGLKQVEMRMNIEQGETLNYLESNRDMELVVTDVTDPAATDEFAIPEKVLAREGTVAIPGTPLKLEVKRYYRNGAVGMRKPSDPPSLATAGVGTNVAVTELPPVTADDEADAREVFVEPVADGRSYGTWLVSAQMGAPQSFLHEGRRYALGLRWRREYLPYSLTLEKFSHDIYVGTDIPKNFSSTVRLVNLGTGEDREVLIYMNHPLRYGGKAFYQQSFGKGDTLSILQVVDNPGWLLPYVACALVALGLMFHFGLAMQRGLEKQAARRQAAQPPSADEVRT